MKAIDIRFLLMGIFFLLYGIVRKNQIEEKVHFRQFFQSFLAGITNSLLFFSLKIGGEII